MNSIELKNFAKENELKEYVLGRWISVENDPYFYGYLFEIVDGEFVRRYRLSPAEIQDRLEELDRKG